jgi:hypothetical protein
MLNRRAVPNRVVMISKDKGITWGTPSKDPASVSTDLGCQANLIRHTRQDEGDSRNRVLFANPADPEDTMKRSNRPVAGRRSAETVVMVANALGWRNAASAMTGSPLVHCCPL